MEGSDAFRREHLAVWELLPWHVTGTLGPQDQARVAAHLATCPACRAALAEERGLARAVRDANPLDAMAERSLAALAPRLGTAPARLPVGAMPPRRRPWLLRGVALAQAAALALAVTALLQPTAPPADFVTLTAPTRSGDAAGPRITVQVAGSVAESAFRGRLLGLGLRIVDGPDAAGRYVLAPADLAIPAWSEQLLAALQAAPEWRPAEAPP